MKPILLLALLTLFQPGGLRAGSDAPRRPAVSPLRVLIVGGGPDLQNNQVAIESNVRYVDRLLDPVGDRRILFADGDAQSKTVLCQGSNGKTYYRAPEIRRIDGPSQLVPVQTEFESLGRRLSTGSSGRALLYFTGHGSGNRASEFNNNEFDLWDNDRLTVKRLAACMDALPARAPVTVVMVQCYSGAFGNLIFEDGDPSQALSPRTVCGFFAAVPQRMAAGCTPSIDEADYQDFTGYFFGALTGVDRLGHRVTGADYYHDGKVTMSEAYAYALIHDDSIDTPTCTSDTFLRRFVKTTDPEVFTAPWSKVRAWATRSQLPALDALCKDLELSGEDLPDRAYHKFHEANGQSEDAYVTHLIRFVRLVKSVVLAHQLEASSDQELKRRFHELAKAEDSNPLTP